MKDFSSTLLSEGRTAEIYAWDDHHVLKLFRDECPSDWVEYESGIAHAVYAAGIPSPMPGEIIEVNGRRGLIYERVHGISMLQEMNARPWTILQQARLLAELQLQINNQAIAGLPTYKERLNYDIRDGSKLNQKLQSKALTLLEALPDGHNLCHGDYHPANVLLTKGKAVVIDWMTACVGVPAADVARTSLTIQLGAKSAGKQVHPILRLMVGLYHRVYLNTYTRLRPETTEELPRWRPVIAAARLSENIISEREALIRMVEHG